MTFAEYGFTLEDYLTKELHLRMERGGRYCCCPLHDENTASFRYYEDEDTFYCFVCNKGGDIVVLHQNLRANEGCKMNYKAALQEVKKIVYKHTKNEKVLGYLSLTRDKTDYEIDGNRVISRKVQRVPKETKEAEVGQEKTDAVEASVVPAETEPATPVVKTVKRKEQRSSLETLRILQGIKTTMYERNTAEAQRKLFLLENP